MHVASLYSKSTIVYDVKSRLQPQIVRLEENEGMCANAAIVDHTDAVIRKFTNQIIEEHPVEQERSCISRDSLRAVTDTTSISYDESYVVRNRRNVSDD